MHYLSQPIAVLSQIDWGNQIAIWTHLIATLSPFYHCFDATELVWRGQLTRVASSLVSLFKATISKAERLQVDWTRSQYFKCSTTYPHPIRKTALRKWTLPLWMSLAGPHSHQPLWIPLFIGLVSVVGSMWSLHIDVLEIEHMLLLQMKTALESVILYTSSHSSLTTCFILYPGVYPPTGLIAQRINVYRGMGSYKPAVGQTEEGEGDSKVKIQNLILYFRWVIVGFSLTVPIIYVCFSQNFKHIVFRLH